jgi:APA family basic amino acid/polyamine antiporter
MVIANMIGTGIFTSLGFQVLDTGIPDAFVIMVIWLLGGVISICGATVYGEIATTIGKSGGEYTFLTELVHPLLGFVSGWVSIIIGFGAAIASLSLAASEYFLPLLGMDGSSQFDIGIATVPIVNICATALIILVVLVHLTGVKSGGVFQNIMTYVKLSLIVVFLTIPIIFSGEYEPSGVSIAPSENSFDMIFSLPFAGALVWVMFAYSGWNASAYIVGNLENPKKNLPFSLIVGTIIVTVIYMLLNYVFLYVARFDELALQVDLGNVVATKVLGEQVGLVFSVVFSLALISGVSAMFIAGPRVAQEIGKDYPLFRGLGAQSGKGAPVTALVILMTISLFLIYFLSFQDLIEFIGMTLSIFSLLTVSSIFILRRKKMHNDSTVKAWLYPVTPIIFMALTLWMIAFFAYNKPIVILWFFITIAPAIVIYFISKNGKA